MTRRIPVFDPRGSAGERTGFVHAGSWSGAPSGSGEKPGYTMWAGPQAIFVNAILPESDLTALEVIVKDRSLILRGPLRPKKNGRAKVSSRFGHAIELPYRVDAQRTEVRKERGLISIALKKEPDPSIGSLESSILNSARRYFGASGTARNNRQEENAILQALDRYFTFLRGMSSSQERRTA